MAISSFNAPPLIDVDHPTPYSLDTSMPLHQLASKRIDKGRDLKIIITADNSQTGVGKTTVAGWLALNWTWIFAGQQWEAERHATLDPKEYFKLLTEIKPGTVLIVDDAEELDARRAMQNLNVEFSQRWMLMRLKQAITILTLPSPSSIDSRLEELADVWINITRRGSGLVHDIGVKAYADRGIYTQQVHRMEFPDVSEHEELNKLREMKEEKMDRWESENDPQESNELSKTQQTFLAMAIKEREDVAWVNLADEDDRLTYSGEFYRQECKELFDDD